MNQRQLASVLFAVAGVFIVAQHIPGLAFWVILMLQAPPPNAESTNFVSERVGRMLTFGGITTTVLIGCALVLFRKSLADRLFPAETQPLRADEFQAVALSVVGCYFVIQGVSGIFDALQLRQLDWGGVARVVLGVTLFLGARGLSRLWTFARTAGTWSSGGQRAV